MLSAADILIPKLKNELAVYGLDAGFVVPTETGLKKSIIDAHDELRSFFRRTGVHDYDKQLQGPNSKVVINVSVVYADSVQPRKMSLYRPKTKSGDPRLWISDLQDYAESGNVIMFLVRNRDIYVVNASRADVLHSRLQEGAPLEKIIKLRT